MKHRQQITTNNLKKIRNQLGLKQQEVAEKLGFYSSDRISHWELGRAMPSVVNLFKLCEIYKVCPCELYVEVIEKI